MFQLITQDSDMTLVQVGDIYLALSPLQNSGAVPLHIKDLKILNWKYVGLYTETSEGCGERQGW